METDGGKLSKKNNELPKSVKDLWSHLSIASRQPVMFEIPGSTLQGYGPGLRIIREITPTGGDGKRSSRRLWKWRSQINKPAIITASRTRQYQGVKQKGSKIGSESPSKRRMGWWRYGWWFGALKPSDSLICTTLLKFNLNLYTHIYQIKSSEVYTFVGFSNYFLVSGPFDTGFGFTYLLAWVPNICLALAIFDLYSGEINFFFYLFYGCAGGITTTGGLATPLSYTLVGDYYFFILS